MDTGASQVALMVKNALARTSLVAQMVKRLSTMWETWVGRFPGEGNDNPLQYSCLENPMDRGDWGRLLSMGSQKVRHDWATSLQCRRCKRHKVSSLGREDRLEEDMTTHSSILAWKTSWTKETGRLQSIGSQRVRHKWSYLAHKKEINNFLSCLKKEPTAGAYCFFLWPTVGTQ